MIVDSEEDALSGAFGAAQPTRKGSDGSANCSLMLLSISITVDTVGL
jgi:hypothetical protein